MTFVENYFLIEAYAMDMTDKLAIVKAFSRGASLTACGLFVFSASQLNVLFVVASVFMLMFILHSHPSSEPMTITNYSLLLPLVSINNATLNIKKLFAQQFNFMEKL